MGDGMITLGSKITVLAGIGPKKGEMFEKLGIHTVGDLLRRFPRAYQNRGDIRTLAEAGMTPEPCAMLLTVATRPVSTQLPNRKVLTKFQVFDDTGKCDVVFFNQNYIKDAFSLGATYRFWGRLVFQRGRWSLSSPQFEPYDSVRRLPDYVPVYPIGAGISQKMMRSTVGIALASLDAVEEILPEEVRERHSLLSLREALYTLHSPRNPEALEGARRYFIFEELFLFALSLAEGRREKTAVKGYPITVSDGIVARFFKALPFTMTEAQLAACREIRDDLASGYAMHRLVSGDVGSGKTVIAAFAAYLAVSGGYQAAMMAPTEILARQHYADLAPTFAAFGMKTALLIGALKPSEKRMLHEQLKNGEIDFVIGTHALLSEGVGFRRPALVITDEQHRFGIRQRQALSEKTAGETALHTLVMSATPIPRTLALALYGDMAVSSVNMMPPGRQKVSTFLCDESYRARLNGFIRKQALEKRQVYIVCPAIEEIDEDEDEKGASLVGLDGKVIEKLPIRYAVDYAEELSRCLPDVTVGCLHGRMSSKEKDAVMSRFESGEISVLVATTVIEVGVNIPNATLMVIENADRFGLSQLHQLRGRVGRGRYKSWCILMSSTENEESLRRLRALCSTSDGFEIAEFDLQQRGPGDFLTGADATRQSGEVRFRIASQCEDTALFTAAFTEAAALLNANPTLCDHEALVEALLDFRRQQHGTTT